MNRWTSRIGGLVAACMITALAGAFTQGCSRERDTSIAPDQARRLLINRNWLHRWPADKDDRLHVYRFVPSMGGGVYQDRTLFVGLFELFVFDVEGDTIKFYLPDNEEVVRSRFRIEKVDGPGPFDLRLTISPSPRGPGVYYGRKSESATTWHELDALLPGRT